MAALHTAATNGFGAQAQAYARGRPDYPPGLLQWLKEALHLTAGQVVVDLGAGTGKFTTMLAETGAQVIAVEPIEAMREQLARNVQDVMILAGCAEEIPLDTGSTNALVCAQAFHWFANAEALGEIHRVLKTGGQLGLVWNVRDESVDWVAAISEIMKPHEGDAPRFYKGDWLKPFSGQAFTPLEKTRLEHWHTGSAQEVILDRFLSVSFIAALPDDKRSGVADQLRALVASHPALRDKDTITFPYHTEAYRCTALK